MENELRFSFNFLDVWILDNIIIRKNIHLQSKIYFRGFQNFNNLLLDFTFN